MPAAVERLKRRPEFVRVARARRTAAAPGLVVQACPREESGLPLRVGFTASRKVGNAVRRNRSRRRLRALVETVMPVHAVAGHDYVVIARSATPERPFDALRRDLESALRRLDLWQEQ